MEWIRVARHRKVYIAGSQGKMIFTSRRVVQVHMQYAADVFFVEIPIHISGGMGVSDIPSQSKAWRFKQRFNPFAKKGGPIVRVFHADRQRRAAYRGGAFVTEVGQIGKIMVAVAFVQIDFPLGQGKVNTPGHMHGEYGDAEPEGYFYGSDNDIAPCLGDFGGEIADIEIFGKMKGQFHCMPIR